MPKDESYTRRLFKTLVNSRIRLATRRSRELQERVDELEQELGKVTLVCLALLTILEEQGQLDELDLERAMRKLDALDGVIDGQVRWRDIPDDILPT